MPGFGFGFGSAAGRRAPAASAPALLALTDRVVLGGNSWEAQGGNIDFAQLAWWHAGCRGVPSIGMRQARGGDRLTHLLDRIEPMKSVRAGLVEVMNPINDFSMAEITNDNAGGDVALARLDSVTAAIAGVSPDARLLVQSACNASALTGKATARARYNAGLATRAAADPARFIVFDPNAAGVAGAIDLANAADSTDATHPNKTASVLKLALNLGAAWAALFVADDLFAAGLSLANNRVTFNQATGWTPTINSSGLVAAQSTGTLRSRPSVACRIFTYTGTSAQDPTGSGTTADHQLRLAMALTGGLSTDMKTFASLLLLEITSASGGDPVGLATIQLNNGWGQTFNKQLVAAESGFLWDTAYSGPAGIMPAQVNGQTTTSNFDLRVRGKQGVAVDFEIRVAAINLIDTEVSAYGPIQSMSEAFTVGDGTNRPVLRAIPTTTPTGTIANGATIAKLAGGSFVGGGATHTFDAMRDGSSDVGDMVPALNGSAAVPYTTVAGDAGHTIVMRHTATSAFGGRSSDSVDATAVTVS